MSQNRYWNLLAKKLSGEALPEELHELEALMRDNPEWIYPAEHVQGIFGLRIPEKDNYDAELAFEMHLSRMKEAGQELPQLEMQEAMPAPQKRSKGILYFSGTALIVLLLISWLWRNGASSQKNLPEPKKFSEVSTRPGSRTRLVLPDSSVVWLNAGSRLTYNEGFGNSNRITSLSGEAFFDVKKDRMPFIIHAGRVQIKVLGTAFNVKSYPSEKTTETSLIRGRVEITMDQRPGEKFILKPNEKLVVANETPGKKDQPEKEQEPIVVLRALTHAKDNSIIETSWVENKLVFQDESFYDLAKRMERWYGVSIRFDNDRLAAERLSGTFTTETVQQAMEELQLAIPFQFSIHANEILITQ
jgi:ferric-dicitrate binding protein FerR (iron transport regulator)